MSLLTSRRRSRLKLFASVLCLASLFLFLIHHHSTKLLNPDNELDRAFKIIEARTKFDAPIFQNWSEQKSVNLDANCKKFWKQLKKSRPSRSLIKQDSAFEPRIYNKSKWMINAKKLKRNKLHEKGQRLNDNHIKELQDQFIRDSIEASRIENSFVRHVSDLRIYGKCTLDSSGPLLELSDKSSRSLLKHLIPWYHGSGEKSFENLITKNLNGRGIIIPLLSDSKISYQIDEIARMINVLRVQGNELPIIVTYSGKDTLPKDEQNILTAAASSVSEAFPTSYDEFLSHNGQRFNPRRQTLSFCNIDEFIAPGTKMSDNLIYFASALLNPFEEIIIMRSWTIPMSEKLENLFANNLYKSQGMLFFKNRPSLGTKPDPFPAGFFEVNDLVNRFARPNSKEKELFGLKSSKDIHTKRVLEKGFLNLLDPSMAVLNKRKTASGLVISSVLQYFPILSPRYDVTSGFNPDLLWLGQELASTMNFVNFNNYFASIPGVPTPPENLPKNMFSRQICSSSWGQIDEDNQSLIYVTSHQLRNRMLPDFSVAVRDKLTIKGESPASENQVAKLDTALADNTVGRNILYITAVLPPIALDEPQYNRNGQPFSSCELISGFGSTNDYCCGYDVVGNVDSPQRGIIYDYNTKDTLKYLTFLDVWLQNP